MKCHTFHEHCHCSNVSLTDEMRQSCKKARGKYFESLQEARDMSEAEKIEMESKRVNALKKDEERFKKIVEKLKSSKDFGARSLFDKVYQRTKKISDKTCSGNTSKKTSDDRKNGESSGNLKRSNNTTGGSSAGKK